MIRSLFRIARRARDEFRYRGSGVECNCCGGIFRSFMPYGHVTVRPNARCPRCFSAERQRMVLHYLRHRTEVFTAPMSVLHFAPEAGIERHLRACARLRYTTADLDGSRADVAMDITDIPHATGTFDLVLCSHVLEHVPDDRKAMREICRVLKPGGRLVILEFATPPSSLVRAGNSFYTKCVMPLTAGLIARDRTGAYRYLPRSIETFLQPPAMMEAMENAGFTDVSATPMTFGVCVCYRGYTAG